jgi:hypothetical protein
MGIERPSNNINNSSKNLTPANNNVLKQIQPVNGPSGSGGAGSIKMEVV